MTRTLMITINYFSRKSYPLLVRTYIPTNNNGLSSDMRDGAISRGMGCFASLLHRYIRAAYNSRKRNNYLYLQSNGQYFCR